MKEQYQSTSDEDLDGHDDSDDDAMVSEDGYTEVTPSFDEDDMLAALEDPPESEPQGETPPQEAYETMKFEAPLDEEEEFALETTPFLTEDPRGNGSDPIRWVDDPDHSEYLINRMMARRKGMDEVLEDEMYGDSLTEEESMDRAGSEVGFGISSFKKIGRRVGSVAKRAGRTAVRTAKKVTSVVKKFVPGRDKGKAKMVKDLNARLVTEHANYLAASDRKRGIKRPVSSYLAASKLWAKNQIQKAGLPTSYTSGSVVAGHILGADACGDWWNPLSWFQGTVNRVLAGTLGQRAAEPPSDDPQAATNPPATDAAPADAAPAEAAPAEEAPPEEAPPEEPPADFSEGDDWTSSLTSAFKAGRKVGDAGVFHQDETEGEFMDRALHRRRNRHQHIEGLIEDVSAGALEEKMIERTGDADVSRRLRRHRHGGHKRVNGGQVAGAKRSSPEARTFKVAIKRQLASGVVSDALVKKWAAARAGAPSGQLYDKLYARMKACVVKRGASISSDKSETSGDFVGWA